MVTKTVQTYDNQPRNKTIMKYIDADLLTSKLTDIATEFITGNYYLDNSEQAVGYEAALVDFERIIDSLQQEPIEKDEETEKLIVCDIIEATIARINGGKKDEEKEENIMREKIAYLRDLGLKGK